MDQMKNEVISSNNLNAETIASQISASANKIDNLTALIKKKDMITYNLVKDTTKSLDTRKHYRRYYGQELEKVKEIMPKESPFNSYDIVRGRSRGFQNPLWRLTKKMKQDHSGEISTETVVGKFKGLIQVQSV